MLDLAVGAAAGQIKIGSLRTPSTVAKYNQLLRIEEWSASALREVCGREPAEERLDAFLRAHVSAHPAR